jgi:hypothetical protein
MFGDSEFQFPFDQEDLEAMSDVPPPPPLLSAMREADIEDAFEAHRPVIQLPVPPHSTEKDHSPISTLSAILAKPLSDASTTELPIVSPIESPLPRQVNFDVPTPVVPQHLLKSLPS